MEEGVTTHPRRHLPAARTVRSTDNADAVLWRLLCGIAVIAVAVLVLLLCITLALAAWLSATARTVTAPLVTAWRAYRTTTPHGADTHAATDEDAAARAACEAAVRSYARVATTGDVLTMQCGSHGLAGLPAIEWWPTHAAWIWVHPRRGGVSHDGGDADDAVRRVFVVECTKFSAPYLRNTWQPTMEHARGVRVVPLWDYVVEARDEWVWMAVRCRRPPPQHQPDSAVARNEAMHDSVRALAVDTWSAIDFEPLIADHMDVSTLASTAVGEIVPRRVAAAWGTASGLLNARARAHSMFCSEFVARSLADLHLISLAPVGGNAGAWNIAPVSCVSGRTLDACAAAAAAAGARDACGWMPEQLLWVAPRAGDRTVRRSWLDTFAVLQGVSRKATHA